MKKLVKILSVGLCLFMFTGCGAQKLSDDYSEEKLKSSAEEIINDLNEEKYEAIVSMGDDKLKEALSVDKLKEAWGNFKDKVGKYDSISKITYQESKGNAIVIVKANYESGKIQFTLSYNKDMKLIGIFMK